MNKIGEKISIANSGVNHFLFRRGKKNPFYNKKHSKEASDKCRSCLGKIRISNVITNEEKVIFENEFKFFNSTISDILVPSVIEIFASQRR